MNPIREFSGRCVVLSMDDIDTDQIIPARFLTTVGQTGLGVSLFADWRYNDDGAPKRDFPLNDPAAAGAEILVAGRNFGCGSSREHAVWALQGAGFRAVIATSFADIFRRNALTNGLLPIQVTTPVWKRIVTASRRPGGAVVRVDLPAEEVTLGDGAAVHFDVDPFSKECLVRGVDELALLLDESDAIGAYEANNPSSLRLDL